MISKRIQTNIFRAGVTLLLGLLITINNPLLADDEARPQRPDTLDLRVPMRLAAKRHSGATG